MTKRQKQLLKSISQQAVKLDWEKAFDGKSYGNKHLFRVNKIAKYLQYKEGGDEFIVLAGAWVHDVALAYGTDSNPKDIKKHTEKFLKNFSTLTNEEIERIIQCAVGHEMGGKGLNNEAQIVHDADVVDKSGMLGIIRHIWKMTNLLENRILDTENDVTNLKRHLIKREQKVFTKIARELVGELNKERDIFFADRLFARKVVGEVSKKARKGITSDNISESIVKLNHPSIVFLKKQLYLEYLR